MAKEKYINKKYNKLTILSIVKNDSEMWKTKVLCKCDCGNEKVITLSNITNGRTKSCGCIQKASKKKQKTHGKSKTRLYKLYYAMVYRCYNTKSNDYKDYGLRGITVCDEWLNDFMSFYNWAYANGYNDDLTIDRIDNNGNYEPNNCRWVDNTTQANNKRTTKYLTYNNKTQSMKQWANELDIPYSFIKYHVTKHKTPLKEIIKKYEKRY